MPKHSYQQINRLFSYNPKTGKIKRKVTASNQIMGSEVGWLDSHGYLAVSIDNSTYRSHRLAWLLYYGSWPELEIDHKNRIRTDNRIINLDCVSAQCNRRNSGLRRDNKSGVKGVCWNRGRNNWLVGITVSGRNLYIGSYQDFDNAVCARLAAEQCVNWSGCDSSSPAYRYVQKHIIKGGKNEKNRQAN